MLLRRATPLAVALAALACEPSVPYDPSNHNPQKVDYGVFQPTPSSSQANPPNVPADIPLPNDLALQPQAIATQPPAQAALLTQWAAQGGFPNDQEVPITIDFVEETIDANTGAATRAAPALDTTSIKPSTLLILSVSLSSGTASAIAYDPPKATDYVTSGDHGTLTIHKSPDATNGGSRRWPANSEIVVAVRGGASGVKVTGNAAGLQPQPAMFLLLQDQDLSLAQNQALITCDPPLPCTREMKAAIGAQLELIRKQYAGLFLAIDGSGAFSHHEIATMGTFKIAPTTKRTHVETDPSAGRIPLPSDFLMDATGHLSSDAQPAFGPLGPGLATLDGFSTTAMVLSQTSSAIQASTVAGGAFIYEVTSAAPGLRRLLEATEALTAGKAPEYAAEPSPIVSGGLSTAIGLQPAVPAKLPSGAVVPIPPLKEGTTYIVLITDKVKDLNGDPLVRSTLGQILFLDPSITIASGGKSTVSGVSDAQAVGLDQMRVALNGAAQALAAEKSISRDHIVMGYTFKTQSAMRSTAALLAALPYSNPTALLGPPSGTTTAIYCGGAAVSNTACTSTSIAAAFTAYGADPAAPNGNIGYVVDTKMTTFNKLLCNAGDTTCKDTGAFNPATVNPVLENIPVLIALPAPPFPGNCIPGATGNSPNGVCTLPLVVFRHGLGGGRAQMLDIADRLAAKGYAVAAIDANKHGDRAFCDPGAATAQCVGGASACVANAAQVGEGDATGHVPGHCTGDFVRRSAGANSIPIASGNYLTSGNIFRTRDTFRQDIIDESQLVRVLSPNPACDITAPPPPATGSAKSCANQMITATTGVQIDPSRIYYAGQSLGAINGVVDVAANPRFSSAAFNVGGSTVSDIFTDPTGAFASSLNALLATLGIAPGTAAYLQFVNVSKWILDPADPENFAQNLLANTIPSPLSNNAAPPPKKILGQMALCDDTVPNTWNANLYTLIGLPFNQGQTNTASASFTTFFAHPTATPTCTTNAVKHGFLLDWTDYPNGTSTNITQLAQDDITGFFAGTAVPPPVEIAP